MDKSRGKFFSAVLCESTPTPAAPAPLIRLNTSDPIHMNIWHDVGIHFNFALRHEIFIKHVVG